MFCPRCGSTNDDAAKACNLCGVSLVEAAEKIAQGPMSKSGPELAGPASKVGTMLGVAIPASGAVAPPSVVKPGTMLGFAAAPGSAPVPEAPAPPIQAPPPTSARQPAVKPGTMLGYAVPASGAPAPPPSMMTATTADPPLRTPRQVLVQLARQHGHALLADKDRCAAELAGESQYATWLLICALEAGVPHQLLSRGGPADEPMLSSLTRELSTARGIHETAARHAVESWAIALGVLAPRG